MTINLSRRTFIGTSAASIAAASSLATFAQGDNPSVTVGSSDYTEQFILAEMLAVLVQEHGYPVDTEHNLGGTFVVHEAHINGEIDVHVEYTGTALTILGKSFADIRGEGESPEAVSDKVTEIVSEEYAQEWNSVWLDSLGFSNTYALAMRREDAEEQGIEKISDLESISSDLVLAGSQEFLIREDGMPGIEEMYGFEFADSVGMDSGLMYTALDEGDVNVISAFSTDGRIQAMDFVLLEDDLGFFPPYHAIPVVRGELLDDAPELRDILNSLAGRIDEPTMQELNFRVDDGGEEFTDVARDFLVNEGLVDSE